MSQKEKERPNARKRAKQAQYDRQRREFLARSAKGAAGLVLAAASIYGGVRIANNINKNNEIKDVIGEALAGLTVPVFPDMTPQEVDKVISEGWTEELQPDLPPDFEAWDRALQERALELGTMTLMGDMTRAMINSTYGPFRETGNIIDANAAKPYQTQPERGSLFLEPEIHTVDSRDLHSLYKGGPALNRDKMWFMYMSANGAFFHPARQSELRSDNLLTKATWALGLVHEIRGHYIMFREMINALSQYGLSDEELAQSTILAIPQNEPFAWAVHASATIPLLVNAHLRNALSDKVVKRAEMWRELRSQGRSWTDPEWTSEINNN